MKALHYKKIVFYRYMLSFRKNKNYLDSRNEITSFKQPFALARLMTNRLHKILAQYLLH